MFIANQTEDHRLMAAALERVMARTNDFEVRRARMAADHPDRLGAWPALLEAGAPTMAFSDVHGGCGGSPADLAAMQMALAPFLPVEPLLMAAVTCGRILSAAGAAGAITAVLDGEMIPVLAHAEGFDPWQPPRLDVSPAPEGLRLNGRKPATRHADVATHFLVTARDAAAGTMILLCPATAPGIGQTALRLIDGAGAADLVFTDTPLPAPAVLLQGAAADAAIHDALDWTLAGLAVEAAALARAATDATLAYLTIREQFGRPLATFQALQHRVADMEIAATEAAAMAGEAIAALDRPSGPDRAQIILAASLVTDTAARHCTHDAVQLHGGMGVSDELVVSHYLRRVAAIRGQAGTHDARAARLLELEART
ncbi:pimeloyl-CoA dehydrogenase (plasmid) [Tistrella mobilis KA081020-065]|uniref:Pimeloyl-CoA dehydrogenase n=2 Tax=Tistrella mobilis TaxID=171437 RepID=I3TT26_TISMK|nr:pimeloyl-CoA dehydrogenase [Tistrella mobilis KA081020-065]